MRNEPPIWKELGKFVHQDFMSMYPDFWSGIEEFARDISNKERGELLEFLEPLVTKEQPGGMLKKIWGDAGAELIFTRIKPKDFFVELYNRISKV